MTPDLKAAVQKPGVEQQPVGGPNDVGPAETRPVRDPGGPDQPGVDGAKAVPEQEQSEQNDEGSEAQGDQSEPAPVTQDLTAQDESDVGDGSPPSAHDPDDPPPPEGEHVTDEERVADVAGSDDLKSAEEPLSVEGLDVLDGSSTAVASERPEPERSEGGRLEQSDDPMYRVVFYSSAELREIEAGVDCEIDGGSLDRSARQERINEHVDSLCEERAVSKAYFAPEPAATVLDALVGNAIAPEWQSKNLAGDAVASGRLYARQYEVHAPNGQDLYIGATAPQGYTAQGYASATGEHASLAGRELQVFAPHESTVGWSAREVGFSDQMEASPSGVNDQKLAHPPNTSEASGLSREQARDKHLNGTSIYEFDHGLEYDVVNRFSGNIYHRRVGQ